MDWDFEIPSRIQDPSFKPLLLNRLNILQKSTDVYIYNL